MQLLKLTEFLLSEEAPKKEKTEMLNSAGSGFSNYTVCFAKESTIMDT